MHWRSPVMCPVDKMARHECQIVLLSQLPTACNPIQFSVMEMVRECSNTEHFFSDCSTSNGIPAFLSSSETDSCMYFSLSVELLRSALKHIQYVVAWPELFDHGGWADASLTINYYMNFPGTRFCHVPSVYIQVKILNEVISCNSLILACSFLSKILK